MKKYLSIFLILATFTLKSQNLLIPYRDGVTWGLSDTLGNILVKPVYDRVVFQETGCEFFITIKNQRYGIVSNREIIKPVFENISGSYYFEADSTINSKKVTYFFNGNGDHLFPNNYKSMELISRIELNPHYDYDYPPKKPLFLFFLGYDTLGKTGLFCYNVLDPKASKLLIESKNHTDLDFETRSIDPNHKVFLFGDKHILVSYDLKQKKLSVMKFNTAEALKKAESKIREDNEKESVESKQPSVIIQDSNIKKYTPPKVRIRSMYELVDGELLLRSSYENLQGLTYHTTSKKVDLNSKAYSISIEIGFTGEIKEDTAINYSTYVLYKKNNKHGFIWGGKIIPNIYDSLYLIRCDSFQYFIFGVRDSTGIMKLGTMKPDGTIIIAPEYNEISYKIFSYYNYINVASSYQWIVKKGSKFGIITPKNKIILDFVYDTIFKANHLIHLNKNGLYGVYYSRYPDEYFKAPVFLIEPFTPYKVLRIVNLPRTNDITKNYIQILELVDQEGRIVGYANPNGLKYFKN